MLFLENIGMGQNWKYEYRAFLDHGEAMMTVLEDSEKNCTLRKYQHPRQINLKKCGKHEFPMLNSSVRDQTDF
jgi:hypothetical protein